MTDKKKVYFNEYNILGKDNTVYLPLVSGHLHAYARKDEIIKANYEFKPYIFYRDYPEKILEKYENPDVAAFSVSMWNANLSLEVARRVKEKFPNCLTIFGGPQVPFDAHEYFQKYPFVDVSVRSDGERIFTQILKRNLESRDFSGIESISFRNKNGECVKDEREQPLQKDLDVYPSPYSEGLFDYLIFSSDINFQAIVETNRGCPFPCSYCFWGQGGLNTKYRFFSMNRVKDIAEWLGKNQIEYVFCADSNFGMLKRDPEIAKMFAATKEKYSYPKRFRVCYGKNAEDTIFETAKILSDADLSKGVTLARQSNDAKTLEINRRKNIPVSMYNELERRYHDADMSTYTELIWGLPGETYDSFKNGLEEILEGCVDNQPYVYHCQVFPNTLLGDPKFQEEHKMQIKYIPMTEIHCSVRKSDFILEDEGIIIGTKTMPTSDWKKGSVLSWVSQFLYGLGAGFFLSNYLFDKHWVQYTDFYEYLGENKIQSDAPMIKNIIDKLHRGAESIIEGNSRSTTVPEFGNVYWDYEEASFFRVSHDKDKFYNELFDVVKEFLALKGKKFNEEEIKEVVEYQKYRTPSYQSLSQREFKFKYNLPEYFDRYFDHKIEIIRSPQTMILENAIDYNGDKEEFAQDIVRRRRNNAVLYESKLIREISNGQAVK